jgi:hypothetical protein
VDLLIAAIIRIHKAATIGRGLPAANGGGYMRGSLQSSATLWNAPLRNVVFAKHPFRYNCRV